MKIHGRNSPTLIISLLLVASFFLSEIPITVNPDIPRQSYLAPKTSLEDDSASSSSLAKYLTSLKQTRTVLGPEDHEEFRTCYETVQSVLKPLLEAAGLNPQAHPLYLVDDPVLNAWLLEGEPAIFVSLGLLLFVAQERLSQDALAFILAHEVRHLRQFEMDSQNQNKPKTNVQRVAQRFTDEYDADAGALRLLEKASFSIRDSESGFQSLRRRLSPGAKSAFGTHPQLLNRIDHIRKIRETLRWEPQALKPPRALPDLFVEEAQKPSARRQSWRKASQITTPQELAEILSQTYGLNDLSFILWAGLNQLKRSGQLSGPQVPEDVHRALEGRLAELLLWPKEVSVNSRQSATTTLAQFLESTVLVDLGLLQAQRSSDKSQRRKKSQAQVPRTEVTSVDWQKVLQLPSETREVLETLETLIRVPLPPSPIPLDSESWETLYLDYLLYSWDGKHLAMHHDETEIPPLFHLRWEDFLGKGVLKLAGILSSEDLLRLFEATGELRDIVHEASGKGLYDMGDADNLDPRLLRLCIEHPDLLKAMDKDVFSAFVENTARMGIYSFTEEDIASTFFRTLIRVAGESVEKQEILRQTVSKISGSHAFILIESALDTSSFFLFGPLPEGTGFMAARAQIRQILGFLESPAYPDLVSALLRDTVIRAVERIVRTEGLSQAESLELLAEFTNSKWYLENQIRHQIFMPFPSEKRSPLWKGHLSPFFSQYVFPSQELKDHVNQRLEHQLGKGPWEQLSFEGRFLFFCYLSGLLRLPHEWEEMEYLVATKSIVSQWSLDQVRSFIQVVKQTSEAIPFDDLLKKRIKPRVLSFSQAEGISRMKREELLLRLGLLGLIKELGVSIETYLPPSVIGSRRLPPEHPLANVSDVNPSTGVSTFIMIPDVNPFTGELNDFNVVTELMGMVRGLRGQRPYWATRLNLGTGISGIRGLFGYLDNREESPVRLAELVRTWLPPSSYRNWALYLIFVEHFLSRQSGVLVAQDQLVNPMILEKSWEELPLNVQSEARRFLREQILPWMIHDTRLDEINELCITELFGRNLLMERIEFKQKSYASEAKDYRDVRFYQLGGPSAQLDLVIGRLLATEFKGQMESTATSSQLLLDQCTSAFPRSSPERDQWLIKIAERSDATLQIWQPIIPLLHNPRLRERLSLKVLRAIRQSNGPMDLADHIQLITQWFPTPSIVRDALLKQLIQEQVTTQQELVQVESLLSVPVEGVRAEGSQSLILAGHDLMQFLIGNLSPSERIEFLGWLFLGEPKPYRLKLYEYQLHVSFDGLQREINQVTGEEEASVSRELRDWLLSLLLDGEKGILNDKEALETLFGKLFDLGFPSEDGFGRVMRTIAESLVAHSGRLRRRELLFHLLVTPEIFSSTPLSSDQTQNRMTRLILESFGLVGVKTGQVLANSASMLGMSSSLQLELATLQDQAPPLEKGLVFRYLDQVYRGRFHERYPRLGKLLGSASVSVVYQVTHASGQTRALKLLRPMIRHRIARDLVILRKVKEDSIARLQSQGVLVTDWLVPYLDQLIRRVEQLVMPELDLTLEAQNTRRLGNLLKQRDSPVKVPEVLENPDFDVLITEFVQDGIKLTDKDGLQKRAFNSHKLLATVATELVRQMSEGFYQGDPHPGNFLVDSKGQIWMLDLGAVYDLPAEQGQFLFEVIQAIALKGDMQSVARSFLKGQVNGNLLEEIESAARKDGSVKDRIMQILLILDKYGYLPEKLALAQRVFLQGGYLFEGLRMWDLMKIAWLMHQAPKRSELKEEVLMAL